MPPSSRRCRLFACHKLDRSRETNPYRKTFVMCESSCEDREKFRSNGDRVYFSGEEGSFKELSGHDEVIFRKG